MPGKPEEIKMVSNAMASISRSKMGLLVDGERAAG